MRGRGGQEVKGVAAVIYTAHDPSLAVDFAFDFAWL